VCVKGVGSDYAALLLEDGFVEKREGVYLKRNSTSEIELRFSYGFVSCVQFTKKVVGIFDEMRFDVFQGMTVDTMDELKYILKQSRIRMKDDIVHLP
jgi:hypothetical protein